MYHLLGKVKEHFLSRLQHLVAHIRPQQWSLMAFPKLPEIGMRTPYVLIIHLFHKSLIREWLVEQHLRARASNRRSALAYTNHSS